MKKLSSKQAPSKPRSQTRQPSPKRPQQPETPFVEGYLSALLALASMAIAREFHAVVREHGFSIQEWRVLATLIDSPAVSMSRLALITLIKQPTLTRMLDRMTEKGLVTRKENESDRRITLVTITPAGLKVIAQLVQLAKMHETKVLEPFGLKRAEALKDTLREIVRSHTPGVMP